MFVTLLVFADENINVVILRSSEEISLDVREVLLKSAMEHIAQAVGLTVRVDAHAIVLTSAGYSAEFSTRTYRVPPDFIGTGSAAK